MDYNMAALVRQKVEEWNRNRAVNPSAPVQGYENGGMPMGIPAPRQSAQPVGIVPGPVNLNTGDNTQLPVKSGEYIWPVEAVLALGKQVLDQQVMGLKREMGDTEPVNNAGPQVGLPMMEPEGYAEGGIVRIIKDLIMPKPTNNPKPPPTFPNPLDPLKQALGGKKGYAEGGMYDEGIDALESLNDSTLGPLPDYSMNTTSVYKPPIMEETAPVEASLPTAKIDAPATGIPASPPIAAPVEKNVPLESSSFLGNKGSSVYAGLNQMLPENRAVGLPTQPKAQKPTGDIAYVQGTGKDATAAYNQPSGYTDDTAKNNGYFGKYELLNADYGKEGYRQGIPGIVDGPTQPTGSVRVMSGLDTTDYTPMGVKDPDARPSYFKMGEKERMFDSTGKEIIGAVADKTEQWSDPYMGEVGGKKVMLKRNLLTNDVKPVVSDTSTTVRVSTGGQNKDFREETSMRKEFYGLDEVKDFATVDSNARRALKSLEESKAKGSKVAIDQSIITTFNKMLDPTSVVRESEYARTPQDTAVWNRVKGKWDKIREGGAGIAPEDREAIVRMVRNYHEIASQKYNEQAAHYTDLAKRYGLKPENVVRLGGKKVGLDVPAPKAGGDNAPTVVAKDAFIQKAISQGYSPKEANAFWQKKNGGR